MTKLTSILCALIAAAQAVKPDTRAPDQNWFSTDPTAFKNFDGVVCFWLGTRFLVVIVIILRANCGAQLRVNLACASATTATATRLHSESVKMGPVCPTFCGRKKFRLTNFQTHRGRSWSLRD
jgi:hypothetical protein